MISAPKIVLLLAAPLLYSADVPEAVRPSTFRSDTGMVLVPVTVTDRSGKSIEGLQRENFTVFDDQMRQPIVSFGRDDSPASIGVILDVSGSMRNTLSLAQDVTHAFFKAANPQDEFFLMTVSSKPDAVSGFTTDIATLEKSVQNSRSSGMTALIDTVYLGLRAMRPARWPRRAILILSDGMDNYSRYSKSELMRAALEADVQIYTIAVSNPAAGASGGIYRPVGALKPIDMARAHEGDNLLEEISVKTGGLHFQIDKESQATTAASKAGEAIRNEYVIGYRAPDSNASGKWHRIRVTADVPRTRVSARNGYYSR
jgi:Ca-activated chloride channel homolog